MIDHDGRDPDRHTDRDLDRVVTDRLARQAERAAVSADLLDGVHLRHRTIRRRRTVGRIAVPAVLLAAVAVVGFGVAQLIDEPRPADDERALGPALDWAAAAHCDGPAAIDGWWGDLIIWLQVGLDDRPVAVAEVLEAHPDVARYSYTDREATYAEFVTYFAAEPEVIALVEPEQLPTSFRVDLVDDPTVDVAAALEVLPGVDEVEQIGC